LFDSWDQGYIKVENIIICRNISNYTSVSLVHEKVFTLDNISFYIGSWRWEKHKRGVNFGGFFFFIIFRCLVDLKRVFKQRFTHKIFILVPPQCRSSWVPLTFKGVNYNHIWLQLLKHNCKRLPIFKSYDKRIYISPLELFYL
jgi:hypothetical protein